MEDEDSTVSNTRKDHVQLVISMMSLCNRCSPNGFPRCRSATIYQQSGSEDTRSSLMASEHYWVSTAIVWQPDLPAMFSFACRRRTCCVIRPIRTDLTWACILGHQRSSTDRSRTAVTDMAYFYRAPVLVAARRSLPPAGPDEKQLKHAAIDNALSH